MLSVVTASNGVKSSGEDLTGPYCTVSNSDSVLQNKHQEEVENEWTPLRIINENSTLIHCFKLLMKMQGLHANENSSQYSNAQSPENSVEIVEMATGNTLGFEDTTSDSTLELAGLPQNSMFVAGGLQQYLIKNMKKAKEEDPQQPRKGFGSDMTTFHDLPDSLHLEIFSYLSSKESCRICQVCRHWYCIASDETSWKHRLKKDSLKWNITGHTLYPESYRSSNPEWTTKEIYLRCSPEVNHLMKQVNSGFHHLSSLFRYLLPKKTPRIAMFGPGLESSTNAIVRKLMEDTTGTFEVCGMFPGQFEGVGSGFTLKMMNSISFHLMTLYTATRSERMARRNQDRVQQSRLLAQQQRQQNNEQNEEEIAPEYEVRDAIKDLCRTTDAFMFVVDASMDHTTVRAAIGELQPMIDTRWSSEKIPLLVLSCAATANDRQIPCLNIASDLRLQSLHRPWQVHDCVVEDCDGLVPALGWLIEQARRV